MVANRDEFHARATARLGWWQDHPGILAGRDLQQGGTWCGVNQQGRFAAITNYRDPDQTSAAKISRGAILSDYLGGTDSIETCLTKLDTQHDAYNGFNLLLGRPDALFYYSNMERQTHLLEPGLYGLSNGLLETPWPKVVSGKQALQWALLSDADSEQLFAVLADQHRPADECLPLTGVSLEWERLLSARFIQSPDYGTRCSTLLRFNSRGEVQMQERSFDPEGQISADEAFRFSYAGTAQ